MRTHAIAAACALAAAHAAPAQTLVVLNKAEATASLLNPRTGETDATIPVGDGPHEAAITPDGRTAVVCNYGQRTPGNTLTVIDLVERTVLRTIDLGEHTRPHGIVFMPDARRVVVTAEGSRNLIIVDTHTGTVEAAINTDQNISHMVALTPDFRLAFVANIGSHSVSVIDLEQRELVKIVETGPQAEGVAVHPVRPEAWITNRQANTVSVINTETLEVEAELDCGLFPIRVAITADGRHALVSCARSGDLAVFDVATRTEVRRIPMQITALEREQRQDRLFADQFGESPVPIGLVIEPGDTRAYIANTNADIITVIDLNTWTITDRLRAGKEPDGMAWSPLPQR